MTRLQFIDLVHCYHAWNQCSMQADMALEEIVVLTFSLSEVVYLVGCSLSIGYVKAHLYSDILPLTMPCLL